MGISKRISSGGENGGGTAKGGWDEGGAISGVGAFGRKCGSAGFGFMSEGLWKSQRENRFKILGGTEAGESLESGSRGEMAWTKGFGSSGRLTKGLFEPVGEALLRADFGTVAGPGTASIC